MLLVVMAACILKMDLNLPLDVLKYINIWHGMNFSFISCHQCKRFQERICVCQGAIGVIILSFRSNSSHSRANLLSFKDMLGLPRSKKLDGSSMSRSLGGMN